MHAIISGAGIAGLSAARFLTEHGWDATVVERAAGPRPEGYMIDFFGPGWEAARAMGILPRLQEVGYHVPEARYVDAAGRTRARLDLADFPAAANGEFVSLLRPDLESAIRDTLPDSVPIHFSSTVTAVEDADDGVTVRLSRRRKLDDGRTVTDRSTMTADLLIGADGIHSGLRALVFGPEEDYFRYLGYHIAAWSYRDAAALRELGSGYALTDTLGEALGFYGLRDGRVALFAVHRTEDPACPPDPCVTLRTRYGRSAGWRRRPCSTVDRTFTTTRWRRLSCPSGTVAGSSCWAMPPERFPCWPARGHRWRWPERTCWRRNWTGHGLPPRAGPPASTSRPPSRRLRRGGARAWNPTRRPGAGPRSGSCRRHRGRASSAARPSAP
jgi:2-polyprenyl-6-methoxyphenol hydroxylase-like FAD-dependent oxidoreductase